MEKSMKLFRKAMDLIELYVPALAFMTLFVAFILQVVSRYVFRNPLVWPFELSQFAYLWTILLGACYAGRKTDGNIVFSIAYEAASPAVRRVFDFVHHALVVILFGVSIPATVQFYRFYMTRYSAVFNFPLGIVYFAFVPFVLITLGRSLYGLVKCVTRKEAARPPKETQL